MKHTFFACLVLLVLSAPRLHAQDFYLNRCQDALTKVLMEDVFTPPVASRVYVYPHIAAYEVLCFNYPKLRPLAGQIPHLSPMPAAGTKVNYSLAAEVAYVQVAKKMIYSEYLLDSFLAQELQLWKAALKNEALIQQSVEYGQTCGAHIIQWLLQDNYTHTRTLERYVLADSLGAWKPTAPEYMNALEPNWQLMRSLVSATPDYVRAIPNIPYSEDKSSVYYKNALAVYESSQRHDSEKIRTALYWDDNPNTAVVNGHLTYFVHKVSPPGHWIAITSQTVYRLKLSEDKAAELFAMVAIGLYEGFISCWNEKYQSNAVRPETYIHRLIDPKWMPLIETPPFPEYTSGHSVISSSAAAMLTHYLPKPHRFTDSTQLYLSLPPRSFNSYTEASEQASVSRFYGGIHYMPSLDNGLEQGRRVAAYIREKIKTRR